jgi:WD40 repeat protein/tRNA A-37 threonylcarbamoyl transferase component Bud32
VPPNQHQADAEVPLAVTRQIDALCDELERTLKQGGAPQLEHYLDRVDPQWRQPLLKELTELVLERLRGHGTITAEDAVLNANPSVRGELASIIAASNGATVTTDHAPRPSGKSGGLSIRCPHCHGAIPMVVDASLMEIVCDNCGGTFSLVNDADATRDAAVLSRVAHFEIIDRLGVGEFGTVWKARDTLLDRTVALKIPRREQLDPLSVEKFMREARAAAQLRHPNIVSTHEVGREGDTLYIVIDYVRGVPLSVMMADHRLGIHEAVEMLAKIAAALDHAHRAGVIHRDLKPSNILVDDNGEPHLMDFGLAKRKELEVSITTDGAILGTPAYMSPEQARGEANRVDGRSDVYSAGVILFQMLTGELPFRGSTRMLLHRVINDEAPGPRTLEGRVPRDLDTICLKCLEKEPARRYATAGELAADLRRFLANQPVHARRLGRVGRTVRWARRNRVLAALLTATIATLLVATLVSTYFGLRAAADAARADRQSQAVTDTLYDSLMQEIKLTRETRVQGYGSTVRQLVDRARALDTPRFDRSELRRQMVLTMGDFVAYSPVVIPTSKETISICVNKDGREVFAGQVSGATSGKLVLYDGATGDELAELAGFDQPVVSIAISNDDRRLIAVDRDGHARIWRREEDEWVSDRDLQFGSGQRQAFCSPDGALVVSSDRKSLNIWNVATAEKIKVVPIDPTWEVRNVGFDLIRRRIIASYLDDDADAVGWALWDLDSDASQPAHQISLPSLGNTYANDIDVSAQGDLMAIGFDEALLIYGMEDFQRINYYGIDSTKAIAFSPTMPYLATANIRGWITIWNSVTNRPLATLQHPRQRTSLDDLAFSADGKYLASSNASSIQIWNLAAADEKLVLTGHRGGIPCAGFDPHGKFLATGGKDDVVRIWNPATAELLRTYKLGEAVQSIAYSTDGRLLAVGCTGRAGAPHLQIFDAKSGRKLYEADATHSDVYSLSWANGLNGTYLACCGPQSVALWLVQPGDPLRLEPVFEMERNRCLATVLSANANWMVWVEDDATLQAWDIANNRLHPLHAPAMRQGWHGLAFLPDGESIIYVNKLGVVEVWNVKQDCHTGSLGSSGTFSAPQIALSPDGKWLAAIIEQNTVSIWHIPTKEHVYSIRPEPSTVWSLAWDSTGEQLAVGQSDGGLAVWNLSKIEEKLAQYGLQWKERD